MLTSARATSPGAARPSRITQAPPCSPPIMPELLTKHLVLKTLVSAGSPAGFLAAILRTQPWRYAARNQRLTERPEISHNAGRCDVWGLRTAPSLLCKT